MKAQKGIPLYYGSKFQDLIGIAKLFSYHEDKNRIVDITQKGYRYPLSPIE